MTCGGAVAAAVISEGMVGFEFRCNSAAGGAKRTGIPLPTGSAKPIQVTDYNRLVTPKEAFWEPKEVFSLLSGTGLRGRWRSAVRGAKLGAPTAPPGRNSRWMTGTVMCCSNGVLPAHRP
jgi:hypothetical protein